MNENNDWRFRTNWRGKLILQRRIKVFVFMETGSDWVLRWFDASVEDLEAYYARQNI